MKNDITRRKFALLSAGFVISYPLLAMESSKAKDKEIIEKLVLSKAQWEKKLTDEQYYILRKAGTERSFSSPLDKEYGEGVYACAGCDLVLFNSDKKYDSKTGWPSFFDVIEGRIETELDFSYIFPITEYHCIRCAGHQGHIFKDGPKPTGLRYCNNGDGLKFIPA